MLRVRSVIQYKWLEMINNALKKNYRNEDGTCSATCLEEMKACKLYGRSFLNGDICVFLNQKLICISIEAFDEAKQGSKD